MVDVLVPVSLKQVLLTVSNKSREDLNSLLLFTLHSSPFSLLLLNVAMKINPCIRGQASEVKQTLRGLSESTARLPEQSGPLDRGKKGGCQGQQAVVLNGQTISAWEIKGSGLGRQWWVYDLVHGCKNDH